MSKVTSGSGPGQAPLFVEDVLTEGTCNSRLLLLSREKCPHSNRDSRFLRIVRGRLERWLSFVADAA